MGKINDVFSNSYNEYHSFYIHTEEKWRFLFRKTPQDFFLEFESLNGQEFSIDVRKNGPIIIYDLLHKTYFVLTLNLEWKKIGIDAFYMDQGGKLFLDNYNSKWLPYETNPKSSNKKRRYRAFKCEGEIITIDNLDELRLYCSPQSIKGKCFFRGQNNLYPIKSNNPILKNIFNNNIPSLIPSGYRTSERKNFDIDLYPNDYDVDIYSDVIHSMGLYHSDHLIDFDSLIEDLQEKIQENLEVFDVELQELIDNFRSVLAQQYISHSNCLDVTSDFEVALFFAISKAVFVDGKLDFIASKSPGFIFEIEDYSWFEIDSYSYADVETLSGELHFEVTSEGSCMLYDSRYFDDWNIELNLNSSRIYKQSASGFQIVDYLHRNQILAQVVNIFQVDPSLVKDIDEFVERKKRELFPDQLNDKMFHILSKSIIRSPSMDLFKLNFHDS